MLKSLNTKKGDLGDTDLFLGGRIRKNAWAIKIGGQLSLFNAAIGKCHRFFNIDSQEDLVALAILSDVQFDLIYTMGEIYTAPENLDLYYEKQKAINSNSIDIIDTLIYDLGERLDNQGYNPKGWVSYGTEGEASAELDYCAELCRTVEPIIYDAEGDGFEVRQEIKTYINRLSKLFYLLARTVRFKNERS
jgi:cob(I)alamin adenosyltransferase